jgi:hypothetical protein
MDRFAISRVRDWLPLNWVRNLLSLNLVMDYWSLDGWKDCWSLDREWNSLGLCRLIIPRWWDWYCGGRFALGRWYSSELVLWIRLILGRFLARLTLDMLLDRVVVLSHIMH